MMKKIFALLLMPLLVCSHAIQSAEALVTPEQVREIKQKMTHELLEQLIHKNESILIFPGKQAVLDDWEHGLSLSISQYNCKGYTSNFELRQSYPILVIQQQFQGSMKKMLEDEHDLRTKILKKMLDSDNFTGLCVKERTRDSAFEWCSTTPEHTQGTYQIKMLLTPQEAKPIKEALRKKLSTKKRKENFDALIPSKL